MRNEDLSGLNANSEAQETEETIANLQEAAVRAPVVIRPGAIRVQPDANGVVVLPAEVALGDIAVVGTDLVIELPDGTQWVIVDGAIFVPQLVIGDVEVPPTNLAALLIGEEPEPAAGQNQSSGGNFAVAVPDLGPPQPLGDLLPPTELDYSPPEPDLLGQFIEDDDEPNIVIETPDNPTGAVNATASVNESGLPEGPGLGRDAGESEGSSAAGNGETTSGTFVYFSPDSPNVLAVDGLVVNGVVITGPGQIIEGAHGFLEIIAVRDGEIDFEYTLTDNTNGNDTTDVFQVTVTDADGDSASANLTISIIDDVPTARPDEDYIAPGGMAASGNVMTGSGTTTGVAGADTKGADGASVVGATGAGETTDGEGSFVVVGQYGVLTIFANGDYSYARDPLSPGGVEDEFTYTLRDGDGDESTTTLTIVIDDLGDEININPDPDGGDTVGEDGLPEGPGLGRDDGESEGSVSEGNSETVTGTITWTDGDGENVIRIDGVIVTGPGQQIPVQGGILTIISYDPDANVIEYSYTLTDNTSGDNTSISFTVTITDADGDVGTDTVTIDIIDDVPEANDDSDTIAAGEYGPETGNVITGAGTNEGLGGSGADVQGADGAEVSGATGFGSTSVAENGDFVVQGQYGVLTIGADGEYSYVRNDGTPGGVEDAFTYTLTDGDGDSVTATLTIEIEDSGVVVGENATVLVDDDALPGGNPGGTGDDPDGANLSGTLSGSGSDEPIGFAFSTAGAPAGFTYVADGANILIQQGGVTVITVTLDAATGGYAVTQNAPIDHAAGGNENNVVFNIGYTVTDVDGDSAGGTLTINADDDTPTVGRTGVAVPDLMVDETNLAANDSASFAGLFSISEGADGGSAVWSLTLSAQGVDSGLVDTATGQSVLLYNNGDGTVEGRTSGSNALVFTVSVDASGTVTLDQVRAVVHPDSPDNYDETIDVDGGAISLTVTVTDGDGDVASQSVDIGGHLNFDDDGPSAGLADEFEAPSLEVDESELGVDDSGNSYADAFDLDGGADGVQSVEYSFTIVEGADSGLVDTATGQSIYLFTDADGNVEGRVGGEAGAVAFEVRVDAGGNVTLDQVRAIVHPDSPDNYDESVSPTAGSIQLTATVTDGDGDEASATLDISGDIRFADDGPSAELADEFQAPSLVVDESDLSQDDDGNAYAGAFDLAGGADGTKSVVYSFTIVEGADSGLMTTDGTKIFLFTDADGNVEGRVGGEGGAVAFEVSVDANGNVSLDQMLSLQHPDNPDNYDEAVSPTAGSIKLTATITDGDNDTASVDLDISGDISFHDDGPSVGRAEVSVPDLNVDETDLVDVDSGVSMADLFDIDFGADGDGGTVFSLTLSSQGVDSGLVDTATGQSIYLYNTAPGIVEGRVGGESGAVAIIVSVNGAGEVSLAQLLALVHPDNPDNYDETIDIDGGVISLTATVTDGDGDEAELSVDIGGNLNFDDDGPSIVVDDQFSAPDLNVDETNLVSIDSGVSFAGAFSKDFGADGDGGTEYTLTLASQGVDSGLVDTATGQSIYLYNTAPGIVEGRVGGEGGAVAIIVSVNGAGEVSLAQLLAIVHPDNPDNYDETVSIADGAISLTATITDGDGDEDSASFDLGDHLTFDDDGPSIDAVGTDGTAGIQVATTSDAEVPDFDLLNLANFFSNTPDGGADGVQSVVVGYSLSVAIAADVPSGLTTGGQPIYLMASLDGTVVQATTGPNGTGSVVFQLDLSGSQVVVQQFMVLDHASGSDSLPLPAGLINANYSATVTDGDGDQATDTASIDLGGNIVFLDDAPMAVDDTDDITEGSTDPATGNVITDADAGDVGDSDNGADDVGNDTPATVVGIVTGGNDAVDTVTNGGGYPLVIDGDYGTLTINADGSYSYVLDNTNPDVNTLPNGVTIDDVFTYTIEDADGDRDSATLTITITGENTAPNVTAVVTNASEEGLPGGNEDSDPNPGDDTNDASISGTFTFSDADGDSLTWSIATPVGSYQHADGTAIVWVQVDSQTVEGRYGSEAGAAIVTATIDNDGNWTFDLDGPLNHGADGNTESEFPISFQITVDDGTDQTISSLTVNVEDDKPVVVGNDQQGDTIQTSDVTLGTDSADYSGSFTIGFGGDGPNNGDADASIVYSLGFNAGATGIYDTATGLEVQLRAGAGGVIEGFVNDGSDHIVFTISVDSDGVVTVDQDRSVVHRDGAFGAESDAPETFAADNLVTLTATATDEDGDSVSDTINIGKDISFADDAPVAANDTDTLGEDAVTAATGNVLYDNAAGDVGDGDAGADDIGNDVNGSVAVVDAVAGNAEGSPTTNGNVVVNGTYGILTIGADGNYSYVLTDAGRAALQSLDDGESVPEVFTYTMVDGDGDLDTALLTITLTGSNDAPTVNAISVSVSEEGLAGGIADNAGVSDDTNSATADSDASLVDGILPFVANDADGDALTFSLGTPAGNFYAADGTAIVWTLSNNDHTLTGTAGNGGPQVIVITISDDGNYQVDLKAPMLHSSAPPAEGDGNIEGAFDIVVPVSVSDGDASTPTSLTVNVEDDKPVVDGATPNANPELVTDDSDITDTDSFDYSTSFSAMFGGDGENGTPDNGLVYTLGTVGGASGLVDTLTGQNVVFVMNGNVLEGRTAGSNALVLTIAVDGDGVVTLTQLRAVVQTNTASDNELVQLADIDNLVTLTATATDEDGDSDSHTIDISGDIAILDDGPTFVLATPSSDAGVIVQTSDADLPTDVDTSTASLLPLFGIATQDYGNDQAAAVDAFVDNFALDVVGYGGVNGVLSNVTVNDNVPVYLHEIGGKIVGSTAMLTANVDAGNTVFDLSVNNTDGADEGKLTLTQYQAIDHSNGEPVILANNLVTATYSATIKDGDGDTASDSKSIDLGGNVRFGDDVPSVNVGAFNGQAVLDETRPEGTDNGGPGASTGDASESFGIAASFTPDYGADGAGSLSYSLHLAGSNVDSGFNTLDGADIRMNQSGNTITGSANGTDYFTITIDTATGVITFTQLANIAHPNGANNDDSVAIQQVAGAITARATVTDADGDSAFASIDLSNNVFVIEDDGPKAFDPEDAPTIQNSSSGGFTGDLDVLAHINTYTGTDGGTVRFPASLHNTDSGMNYQGVDIVWNVSSDGQTLTGIAGATPILTITLDQGASTYTIDMLLPVDAFTDFQFTDANSDFTGGNGSWFGIVPNGQNDKGTPVDDDSFDVLITGNTGSTINTSGILGGVDTGQSIESGEFIQLDYVIDLRDTGNNGPVGGGYNPATADHIFDSHVPSTNGASVLFQKQSGAPSSFNIRAYDDSDANGNNVRSGADRTQDTINGIIISYDGVSTYNGTANSLITADGIYQINGKTYIVDFKVDGSVDVKGVTAGNNVSDPSTNVAVFTANGYNSLVFENINATDGIVGNDTATIKFGGFGAQIPTTNPVDFSVPIQIVDGDGDVVAGDTMDFSLVASGGSTTMAIEKIALGEPQAANDDFLMVQLDEGRSLMMSSALALGFAAALPAKFAWDGFGDSHVLSADLADYDVPAFGAAMLPGSTATSVAGVSTVSVSLGGDVVGGQSALVSAQEAIDVSLDSELAIEDAASAPKGDTAQIAVAEQIAIVDGADVAMPGAEALAAIVAAKVGGGIDLALVGKEAIIETGEGDVDALLAGIGDGHAGAPEAIATLMVVGQEALDAAYDGYLPANTDALLSDAMLLHMDAAGSAAHG